MSIFPYLQPQVIDPQDDGSVSEFDQYTPDEVIDLTQEQDGELLMQEWAEIEKDLHRHASRDE